MRYKFRVIIKYQHDQIDIFDDSCGDWRLEFNEGHEAQLLLWDYDREGWRKCDDDFEVLQFTGLKDRNGKEVYEGDFLKCNIPVEIIDNNLNSLDGETVIAKVLFENGCFMAEAKTINYPWVLNGDKTILSWLLDIKAYDRYTVTSEVIGNVWENPELLEAKA